MKKRLYLIAAAALALVACAKEEAYQSTESTIPGAKRIVLGASFELPGDPTKSDYDADGNFTWSNDDAIWIGSNETNGDKKWGSGSIIKGQSEIGPGHATAQFDCTLQGDVTAIAAVFPKTVEPSYSAGTLSLTLPATIAWTDTQLANPANATMQVDNIMVARYVDIYSGGYAHGTTQNIQFHNVGGLFCLTLKNVPAGADKLVFTADKKINGTFTVSNVDDSKDGKNYPVIATAATKTESEKSVTITFPTISNGENKMTFFIPVPVGSYVIGFDVQNAEAKSLWAFSASKPNAVERGYIIKMPTLSHVIVGGSGDGATNIITTPTGFSGTVNLPSTNNSIYVRMNQTGGAITLAYADAPALHPANVYLQALGNVETLNINLPDSHVELTGEDAVQHVITNVSSYTSYSTLKVDKKVKIGKDEDKNSGITITGGSLDLDAPVEGKVTVNIPAANNNKTEEKVAINITSAIKDLVVTRAADNVTPADKVYVSLGNGASVAETIDVPEVNCNLYVAPGVTVKVIDTKAAENTVEGDVQTLSASGASTIVTVTSEANVTTKIEATGGATIIVDENALKDDNDNAYASANNQTKDENSTITTVDTGSVALVGNTGYDTLAKAINAADNGATITIIKAGEYDALPALTKTLTFVSSVDGVIINQTKNAEIDAEKTVTFKNIAFNLSDVQYLGFGKKSDSANGALVMEGCTIEGSLSLYGMSTFKDCKFTASGKYNIWAVLTGASFSDCSFTNTNRAVNVYDFKHGISVKNVSFSGCTFAGTEKKKAAINIHHNPDGTVAKYAVTITNCTTSGTWASSVEETGEPADATICNSALWMVSDIKNWTNGDITVNGENVYEVFVAQIKDVKYATIKDAFAAVPDNTPTTITMIANAMINVAGSALTVPTNKDITLDLNGFQVVGTAETGNTSALITNNGTLTIKDSSDSNADGTGTGKLISGATPTWKWDGSDNFSGSYASNTITNCGTLTIESGYLQNTSSGSATYAVDNNSGSRTATLNVNGGYLTAVSTVVRQFCNSTKNQNTVNITAGSIATSGKAGIWTQLPGRNNQEKLATLNVTGGTVSAASYAWYDYSFGDSFAAVNYAISGGTFTGLLYSYAVIKYGVKPGFITGGTFDSDPSDLVAAGYEAVENGNGTWTVQKLQGVAKIGTTTYATLAEAVAAVPTTGGEATTITMVADVANATGMSVAAGKNFTVDFNNHTYTLNKPGAGSAGTETIGFQLLQGSTITFKNGTINISEENLAKATIGNNIKRVIQNYANLTLDNMTIDGTNQYDKKDYVVSFNNGTSVIKDTKIKGADASKVIFDVCTWETYVATSVTVSGSSLIDGNIEVSASNNPQTLALTLRGGTHNGSLVMASGADKATITKSDSFSENAPEGYNWKDNGDGTSTLAANVAKIGESYYATLADAVAAVPENTKTTIRMIADETMADNTVISIPATKNIVLDLNGKTISSVGGSASAAYYFIQNRGTLEINDFSSGKNGKITSACTNPSPGYSYEYVTIYNIGGTLTLTAGTVETTSGGLSYAINNSSNAWGIGDDKETIFNMTGGTIISPSGDAGLRVYQNCAQNSNPFSHNTVNISGGTIASGGIFLDNFIYEPNVNTTGAGISTNVTISGGEIHGLIDVKLRHAFNTTFTITGGTFVDSKLWVRKHSEWKSVVAEPTAPLFFISGGNFSFTQNKAFGLAYDCSGTSWSSYTNPYSITGGTFNVNPATYVAAGYEAVQYGNNWNVKVKAQTGYAWDNGVLPSAPSVSGNVINVTNANAQYVLDGAYGSIDGKTINFTENITSTLELGRPTKYAGSNTKYYRSSYNTEERTLEFIVENSGKVVDGNYTNLYKRSVKNVKFTANSGVSIKGIHCNAGSHIYGAGSYDCVREIHTTSEGGSLYFCANDIEGISFEGITFTSPSNLETSVTEASMKNVTFKNCIFNIGSTDSGNYALRYYQESKTTSEVKNLVVDGCVFNTVYQGVYTMHINGVTVKDCTFSTTGHNAIAVQTQDVAFNHGNVVLTGNTGTGIGDRFIRFNNVASGTNITITGNNATCSKGTNDEECIKASSLASSGITYNVSGNTWINYKEAYNEELRDK